jgi:hypothetical protein
MTSYSSPDVPNESPNMNTTKVVLSPLWAFPAPPA